MSARLWANAAVAVVAGGLASVLCAVGYVLYLVALFLVKAYLVATRRFR